MNTNEHRTGELTAAEPGGMTRGRLLRDAGLLGGALVAGGSLGAGRGLAELSSSAAAATVASSLALSPEQEEGPFYVALEKIRKNITLGRAGVPLMLRMTILNSQTGKPIQSAACDIWQCDATGVYSDEASENSIGATWLRGVQFTDKSGLAEFETIYPGHYSGRATHIHVKVHIGGSKSGTTYTGGHVSHTGQLFFDDTISGQVYTLAPYTSDSAARVLDPVDHVYTEQGGSKSKLKLSRLGSSISDGLLGTITLAVDPALTPAKVGATSGGGAPPGS